MDRTAARVEGAHPPNGKYQGQCTTNATPVKEYFTLVFIYNANGGYNISGTNTNKFVGKGNIKHITGVVQPAPAGSLGWRSREGVTMTLWVSIFISTA
jgi:hypothetical protein